MFLIKIAQIADALNSIIDYTNCKISDVKVAINFNPVNGALLRRE